MGKRLIEHRELGLKGREQLNDFLTRITVKSNGVITRMRSVLQASK